jgi:hypothetical protein
MRKEVFVAYFKTLSRQATKPSGTKGSVRGRGHNPEPSKCQSEASRLEETYNIYVSIKEEGIIRTAAPEMVCTASGFIFWNEHGFKLGGENFIGKR